MEVGIIGAGGMGRTHSDYLTTIDGVAVTDIVDVDVERARSLASAIGATTYTEYRTMYSDRGEDLDAVVITVPPFAHDEQELLAVEHELPFLVEKPLPLDSDLAYEIRDAVVAAGLVTQVGYQRRYNAVVERAMSLIGDRDIAFASGQRQSSVPDTPWWGEKARSGGQLFEMSTHDFDLLRHFAGEVDTVAAVGGHRVVEEIDFEDATVAAMRHENGVVSHIGATSAAPDWNSTFVLVGDGFRLEFDYLDGTLSGCVDGEPVSFETAVTQRQAQAAAFVDAVRADNPALPRSPYPDAVNTFELTRAADNALQRNESIDVTCHDTSVLV